MTASSRLLALAVAACVTKSRICAASDGVDSFHVDEANVNGDMLTLYRLPKNMFDNFQSGKKKYEDTCADAGMKTVGCGTETFTCGDGCVPLPASWGCRAIAGIYEQTGWDDIVAYENDGVSGTLFAVSESTARSPNTNMMLSPICAAFQTTVTTTMTTSTMTSTTPQECRLGDHDVGGVCSPCPSGWLSTGNSSCQEMVSSFRTHSPADPSLSATGEDNGVARLSLTVDPLPTNLYDADLAYSVDIALDADSLSRGSSCDSLWDHSTNEFSVSLKYAQLNGLCRLKAEDRESHIATMGVLGLFLLNKREGANTIVKSWVFPLELLFPMAVVSTYTKKSLIAYPPKLLATGSLAYEGAFGGILKLYEKHDYKTVKENISYWGGDRLYAELSLDDYSPDLPSDLPMTLVAAWVSEFPDPMMEMHTNLTAIAEEEGPGLVRFNAELEECTPCYLHVQCSVALPGAGRRLASQHDLLFREPIDVFKATTPPPEEELPLLSHPVELVLILSFLGAVVLTCFFSVALCLASRDDKDGEGKSEYWKFFVVEFFDVITDIGTYILCKEEGDLEFQNDPDGVLMTALIVSVVFSASCWFFEMLFLIHPKTQKCFHKHLKLFSCFHALGEDLFQFCLYMVVAFSQAASGGGTSMTLIAANSQVVVFLLAKLLELFNPSMLAKLFDLFVGLACKCCHRGKGAEEPDCGAENRS